MAFEALHQFIQKTLNGKRFLTQLFFELAIQIGCIAILSPLFFRWDYVLRVHRAVMYVITDDYGNIVHNFTGIGQLIYIIVRIFPILFTLVVISIWVFKRYSSALLYPFKQYINARLFEHSDNSFFAELYTRITITLGVFSAAYFLLTPLLTFGTTPFYDFVVLLSRLLVLFLAIQLGKAIHTHHYSFKVIIDNYFNAKELPYALAIFRIVYACLLLFGLYMPTHELYHWAELGKEDRVALPFIGWLIDIIPISKGLYLFVCQVAIISAFGLMFGFFTRLSGIILTLSLFYIWSVPCFFGKLNHNQVQCWTALILALSNSGRVLSIDSLIRKFIFKESIDTQPQRAFSLPFRLIWLMLGIMYFWSGVHKLWDNGLCWTYSDHFIYQIQEEWIENFNRIPGFRIDHYPTLAKALGMATIYFELLYIFWILSPYTRWMAIFSGLTLHLSARYFMNIGFENIQHVYVSYINWNKLLRKKTKTAISRFYHVGNTFAPSVRDKTLIVVIGLLLFGNSLCGLFQIHTWPISAYPSYSNLASGSTYVMKFILNEKVDMDSIMKARHFRKENYRRFETEIFKLEANPAQQQEAVLKLWKKYQTSVPELQQYKNINVYQDSIAVNPDLGDHILGRKLLLSAKVSE